MRQPRTGGELGVMVFCVVVATGCASAGRAPGDGRAAPERWMADARTGISERIAARVEAVSTKDIDGALDGAVLTLTDANGRPVSREQLREAVLRDWAAIDHTVELTVRIDSIQLADADRARVYTTQRWHRVVRAADGARHDVITTSEMAQDWAKLRDGWRGIGTGTLLAEGPTLVDGREEPCWYVGGASVARQPSAIHAVAARANSGGTTCAPSNSR